MEQTCSNIAVQRIIDDHTNYMVRTRPKCEIGREATEYWSVTIWTPTPYPNMGDYEGRIGLSPPAAYPSTVE